jgi:hypothetical protein
VVFGMDTLRKSSGAHTGAALAKIGVGLASARGRLAGCARTATLKVKNKNQTAASVFMVVVDAKTCRAQDKPRAQAAIWRQHDSQRQYELSVEDGAPRSQRQAAVSTSPLPFFIRSAAARGGGLPQRYQPDGRAEQN